VATENNSDPFCSPGNRRKPVAKRARKVGKEVWRWAHSPNCNTPPFSAPELGCARLPTYQNNLSELRTAQNGATSARSNIVDSGDERRGASACAAAIVLNTSTRASDVYTSARKNGLARFARQGLSWDLWDCYTFLISNGFGNSACCGKRGDEFRQRFSISTLEPDRRLTWRLLPRAPQPRRPARPNRGGVSRYVRKPTFFAA
jgi:hypothetical protein